jgi:type IV pilus assembly protein PilY1
VATTTDVFTQNISGSTVIKTSPTTTDTTAPADVDGICYTPGVAPALPPLPTARPTLPSGCLAWPCAVDTSNPVGGSSNSLADVAQYYYMNDLRPEMDDGTSTLRGIDDNAPWQHMSTYGLGLGVSGTLTFKPDYLTSFTGDFSLIRPPATASTTQLLPTLQWPVWPDPAVNYASDARFYNDAKSIDDFWHAAVNGRGQYFSAGDPTAVVDALGGALAKIDSVSGAGSAVTLSTSAPTADDNFSFLSTYKTGEWSGDVIEQRVDVTTGALSTSAAWSAQAILDAVPLAACDNRKIYYRKVGGTNDLANFSWNTKSCLSGAPAPGAADTGLTSVEQAYFGASAVAGLTQYATMTDGSGGTVDQRGTAAGSNMVNFIRGQRGLEVPTDAFIPNNLSTLYRKRAHVLGDIVGSSIAFVKEPSAGYADTGYAGFKAAHTGRTPMIYVGANDGMLHAFYAATSPTDTNYAKAGSEAWAYVPQAVMPELYRLADTNYKVRHRYFVDGSPIYGDIYDAPNDAWKSIRVGGLNKGGKGFYALDVTDPVNPKSLWEFNLSSTCYDATNSSTANADCHIGLSFGRPIITKLASGTWVVLLTSGYNNVRATPGTGDGGGYLYVLNAATGKIISKLATNVGDSTTPSGLREVNNYVANGALDNTTLRVYGGDLLGNIWRFDVNDSIDPAGKEATLVAVAKDASDVPQPISTRVQLAEVDGVTMVVAGTGEFLGETDKQSTQVQSVYGFKDPISSTVLYPDLRGVSKVIGLTKSGLTRISGCSVVANCTFTDGWVVDLPEAGERINIDPFIVAGTVAFVSNVPTSSGCEAGGHSWLNYVNLLTGGTVPSSEHGESSVYLADALAVGHTPVFLPDGTVKDEVIFSTGGPNGAPPNIPVEPPSPVGRRVSWREIRK